MCNSRDQNGKLIMCLSYHRFYRPCFEKKSGSTAKGQTFVFVAIKKSDVTFHWPHSESALRPSLVMTSFVYWIVFFSGATAKCHFTVPCITQTGEIILHGVFTVVSISRLLTDSLWVRHCTNADLYYWTWLADVQLLSFHSCWLFLLFLHCGSVFISETFSSASRRVGRYVGPGGILPTEKVSIF